MTYNPEIHHRRSIRLKGFDYSRPGEYFVTICTQNRICLFGDVINGTMVLNKYGKIVEKCWFDLPNHYNNVKLNEYIIMPNHFHGIISMVGVGFKPTPTMDEHIGKCHGLSEIVRALKTFSARQINEIKNSPGVPVWQRNYYEHIIRDDDSYYRISAYIKNNPVNWEKDDYNE